MKQILLDTGPLVAVLDRDDSRHAGCVEALNNIDGDLVTCWPVLIEAAWLLRRQPKAMHELLLAPGKGIMQILDLPVESLAWIASFYERYSNLAPDLADIALMYLAETEKIDTIFTLDRRDFSIYRLSRNRRMRLVPV